MVHVSRYVCTEIDKFKALKVHGKDPESARELTRHAAHTLFMEIPFKQNNANFTGRYYGRSVSLYLEQLIHSIAMAKVYKTQTLIMTTFRAT